MTDTPNRTPVNLAAWRRQHARPAALAPAAPGAVLPFRGKPTSHDLVNAAEVCHRVGLLDAAALLLRQLMASREAIPAEERERAMAVALRLQGDAS